MDKVLSLILICVIYVNNVFCQFEYLDASELAKHINNKGELKSDDQIVFSILSKYLPDSSKMTAKEIPEQIFNGNINPFIKLTKRTKQISTIYTSNNTQGFPSGEFLYSSNYKISDLLPIIKNDELTATFFQTLKNSFESNEALEKMMPVSYKFISTIDENRISLVMSVLKESFLIDLNNILFNLPNIFSDEQYKEIVSKYPDIETESEISLFAVNFISKIIQGTHPVYLIKDFSKQSEVKNMNRNLNNSLNLISLISESFRDTLSNKAWISLKAFNDDYIKNPDIFKIYLGLLFMKGNNIIFKIKNPDNKSKLQTLQGYLKENKDKTSKIFPFFYNFLKYSNNIENNLKDIKNINIINDTIPQVKYYNYLNSSVRLLEYGLNYSNLFSPGISINDSLICSFIDISKKEYDIYKYLNEKNYSAAIMTSFYILNYLTKYNKIEEHLQSDAKLESADKKTKDDIDRKLEFINKNRVFKDELLKYMIFASYFVESRSNDEVVAAIESISFPNGKSIKNKQNVFSITLNLFTGLFCGNENITGNYINTAGIFLPVGIAFKQGISKNNNQYLGFFVSLINFGELSSFHLQNSNYEDLPELKIENIFTPGGYIIYGFPKIPISFGIGANYGPAFRNSLIPVIKSLPFNYSVNAFLAVDMNLINFYSKQKALKKKQAGKSLL